MRRPARVVFAAGLIGLGVLGLINGDFALQWQPVPAWVPARAFLAYVSGIVLVGTGAGLLSERRAVRTSRVLLGYLLLWLCLLQLPRAAMSPWIEAFWNSAGEIAVIVAGGLVLVGLNPRWLFAFALMPIGLAHFVYITQTAEFVPAWLPFRTGWAYFTGAAHLAAGFGVLFGVYPRLAAALEAAMIGVFTVLVWVPGVIAAPANRLQWTGLLISWTIGAGAWLVATHE